MSEVLDSNFNGYPKVTDWDKVYFLLQQANSKGFNGATKKEIVQELFGDVSIQGADFFDLPVATSSSVVALPIPTVANKFGFLANGKYSQPNGPILEYTGKQWGLTLFDGTKWVKKFTMDLPTTPLDDSVATYIDSLFEVDFKNLYDKANNVTGKYANTAGDIASSAGTILNVMPVSIGQEIAVKAPSLPNNAFVVVFRNSSSTADGPTLGKATLTSTSDPLIKTFVVPNVEGISHAFINVKLPNITWDISDTLIVQLGKTVNNPEVSRVMGADLVDKSAIRKSELHGDLPLYDPNRNVLNRYVVLPGANSIGSTSSLALVNYFPVEEGERYSIKSDNWASSAFAIAFRSTSSTEPGAAIPVGTLDPTTDPKVKTFIAPEGAKFGFVNVKLPSLNWDITNSIEINRGSGIIEEPTVSKIGDATLADNNARYRLDLVESKMSGLVFSILKGLKWILIGDSITERNYRATENYHYYVSQLVGGMTRYNYGISGTGFYDRYNVADTITQTTADIISIFWGTNDWGNQNANNKKRLGVFQDTDVTTISWAINTCLTKLIAKFPTTPIVLFTPLPRANNWGLNASNNAYGYTLKQLSDLLIKYAQHYSLPVLDLYSHSGLFPWNADANQFFFKAAGLDPDGLHPNDEGHKYLAKKIKVFLESVIR